MPTETDKQRALEAIRLLPEGATIEDAIERLCFIAKNEEGLPQSRAGQAVSHDEVKKRFLNLRWSMLFANQRNPLPADFRNAEVSADLSG
jgi:hypothetical protein